MPQHASEPFAPPALTTSFSLGLVTKQVLGWVLVFFSLVFLCKGATWDVSISVELTQWLHENPLLVEGRSDAALKLNIVRIEQLAAKSARNDLWVVHLHPRGYIVFRENPALQVIGFSFTSDLQLDHVSGQALQDLLQRHSDSKSDVRRYLSLGLHGPKPLKNPVITPPVVGPLLSTAWSQMNHFNEYCPADPFAPDSYDGKTPMGCVPTLFAQIMKYYQWPSQGIGAMSYEDSGGAIRGSHAASFAEPYPWWDMQNEYDPFGAESEVAVEAVAQLMYDLGVAAQTDFESYVSGGSLANPTILGNRLNQYFFYERPVHHAVETGPYPIDELVQELALGRPCVASIPDHSFVLDGYMQQGQEVFFHANYGWGGQNDGWYLMTDVQGALVVELLTHIIPQLVPLPLSPSYLDQGIALRWVIPEKRGPEVQRIDVLQETLESGNISDDTGDFAFFRKTSTSDFKDWIIAAEGVTGSCFYKEAGGYGNVEYHLTTQQTVQPTQDSQLVFWEKHLLFDDCLEVAVSTDEGGQFETIWVRCDHIQNDWRRVTLPLGAYAGQALHIRFAYVPGMQYYVGGGAWVSGISMTKVEYGRWEVIDQITEPIVHKAASMIQSLDEAEAFSDFVVTSTDSFMDWTLSDAGVSGRCFHKPSGGYGGQGYHLTSKAGLIPSQDSFLVFSTRYALAGDAFKVQISLDQGKRFTDIWSVTDLSHTQWSDIRLPLGDYQGRSILLRFAYLPGTYYPDGGIWIDNIRLVQITNPQYSDQPHYSHILQGLPPGIHTLAYQVWSGEQLHERSVPFSVDVPK